MHREIDTGPGIEENTLAFIFNPFYTTKLPGTGLGLASSSKGFSEEHKGIERTHIRLGDNIQGVSARLGILFSWSTILQGGHMKKILVVDDDLHIQKLYKGSCFGRRGVPRPLWQAAAPRQWSCLFRKTLILCHVDILMPDVDGIKAS